MDAATAFLQIFEHLPRQGPGNRASTARALALTGLGGALDVLDLGCGNGAQTLDLAHLLPEARITAVDRHRPFLATVRERAAAAGVDRIRPVFADMGDLPFEPGSFDLVWSEGAAYSLGIATALERWRPLLRPGGALALTDAVWLTPDLPADLRDWWESEYPAITDLAGRRRTFTDAGWRLLGDFVLPPEAWTETYYAPMRARMADLADAFAPHPAARGVLAEHREEADLYDRHQAHFGYAFFVATPGGPDPG